MLRSGLHSSGFAFKSMVFLASQLFCIAFRRPFGLAASERNCVAIVSLKCSWSAFLLASILPIISSFGLQEFPDFHVCSVAL